MGLFCAVFKHKRAGLPKEFTVVRRNGCLLYTSDLAAASERIARYEAHGNFAYNAPLFESKADYDAFLDRHGSCRAVRASLESYNEPVYLGFDAGSTTVKACLLYTSRCV